ncbi:MAG TPA: hypothetical protein VLV76_05185 [Candidatus Acidoferrum sp.]|nr:hypothetical protein [Candidatus Acidoferrum sp.]
MAPHLGTITLIVLALVAAGFLVYCIVRGLVLLGEGLHSLPKLIRQGPIYAQKIPGLPARYFRHLRTLTRSGAGGWAEAVMTVFYTLFALAIIALLATAAFL